MSITQCGEKGLSHKALGELYQVLRKQNYITDYGKKRNYVTKAPFHTRQEQFSKGPLLNCSIVVKLYKVYLACEMTTIATFDNHAKIKQGSLVKLLGCE